MSTRPFFAFALVALSACSFEPVSGDYLLEETSSETDCETTDTGDTGGEAEAEPFAVEVNAEKTSMVLYDGVLTCTLDGKSFDCPFEPIVTDLTSSGIDYVSTYEATFTGSWTSNESFDVDSSFTMSCEGADCETYAGQNCSGSAAGEATLVE